MEYDLVNFIGSIPEIYLLVGGIVLLVCFAIAVLKKGIKIAGILIVIIFLYSKFVM